MKLTSIVFAILVFIGLLILGFKLISGAISIIGGFLNTLLGLAVIVALIAIVIWMFMYARKGR